MTKQEIISAIADKTGHTKVAVGEILEALPETLLGALKESGRVTIPGVGIASVKHRPARMGRNPQTGAAMEISARDAVVIKPLSRFSVQ